MVGMTYTTPFTGTPVRPPFDAELVAPLQAFRSLVPWLSTDTLDAVRELSTTGLPGQPMPDFTAGGAVRDRKSVV